ncbi:DUF3325 domain-containing protein [Pseudomonas sp. 2FG]|uniref:DUF3325 domain-containing protein n=1 Tax=Pseudomonas sp. 2FG TaxID=2502191 RepID=UPI0010FA2870|nr:DUF3325 domain-containing protein [Pseudomonas sp. 2FG]
MLCLSFALSYLAMTALSLAMSRHHQAILSGAPSPLRSRVLRIAAVLAFGIALGLCSERLGGEIGALIWLCQLMLAGLLLVALLAWRSRWVLPLSLLLPLGGLLPLAA